MRKPKYKFGDKIEFTENDYTFTGIIYIPYVQFLGIDDHVEYMYDIMDNNFRRSKCKETDIVKSSSKIKLDIPIGSAERIVNINNSQSNNILELLVITSETDRYDLNIIKRLSILLNKDNTQFKKIMANQLIAYIERKHNKRK